MSKKKEYIIFRRVLFLIITIAIIIHVAVIFERKTILGDWNYSIKVGGFKNEPENSFDVVGVGSSHMYCTLNPVYLYEQTGLRSYVLATQQQPPIASYYYIKEMFETQKPDVLIIEGFMFTTNNEKINEGVAHDAIDPFPNTINKLQMIQRMNQEDAKENYYLNFLKYHSRWKELQYYDFSTDYRNETDPYHGYVFLTKAESVDFFHISYEDSDCAELSEENMNILMDIQKLADENGSTLVILIAPFSYNDSLKASLKSIHIFASQHNIPIIDMNLENRKLDFCDTTDFYDNGHLNVYGAEKATAYLGNYIMENYTVTQKNANDANLWAADIEIYNQRKMENS